MTIQCTAIVVVPYRNNLNLREMSATVMQNYLRSCFLKREIMFCSAEAMKKALASNNKEKSIAVNY